MKTWTGLSVGISFAVFVTSLGCIHTQDANKKTHNATMSLNEFLIKGYDKAIRPDCDKATDVHLDFYVESFGKIEEANLEEFREQPTRPTFNLRPYYIYIEFSVFMYFRQLWRDPRLANLVNSTVILERDMISTVWFPDTYCSNAKKSDLMSPDHEVHSSLTLEPDGSIFYSRAAHIIASCVMDLRNFPMDKQYCHLNFGSYGYTDREIKLSWESDGIIIANKEMAQFSVKDCKLSTTTMKYVKGNYTMLTATFPMHRRLGYYAIQMYVPCTFLVTLSWIVFWMSPEETGNRLTVGITTILTIVFLLGYTNSTLPKVSYVKGMDWYLMVSFLFIFLSLAECIVVDKASRMATRDSKKAKKKSKRKQLSNRNGFRNCPDIPIIRSENFKQETETPQVENVNLFEQKPREENANTYRPQSNRDPEAWREGEENLNEEQRNENCDTVLRCIYNPERSPCGKSLATTVDRCSRFLFPFLFVVYNVFYWYTYYFGGKFY